MDKVFLMSGTMLNSILDWWLSVFGDIEIQCQTEILNEIKIWDARTRSLFPAICKGNVCMEMMSLF